ncbi:putative xyloglucan:xyloglucosyl transferase [Helianthus annuus]|uniref:Xyloglucan endotransglucosylase/hydrolase n=1 Tax=Helianthus annuus TaxID=4232 RepID=A0A251V6H7_HELAN|nr:probable xyloglucan endotransglucosylase/hydrolase protein 10 [Helianthus annuus]KAF5814200.1 putative xyloglucan:xyloglucosyl transferase [Helianthus annuus]KAJ0592868.1 putative xyloglucan:xyloglucosyl transferase [Helianthus annuus]KAJ0600553.1 putative xyloglucan:xyloglucosyl transferase [Helianthus annuus]KAJ0607870.1 putative xyloglucan:xyloglucosyl transferase [Helianthus annuus]KAJ0767934.1 putative xyloglucan:xyloglucosyl transferase [Helianthus annuus]
MTQINYKNKVMDKLKSIFLCGIFLLYSLQTSLASVVSTGNFNNDFFVTWSPSHVNTSADGRSRSLKLDQEAGSAFASNDMFLFGQIDMPIKLVPGHSAGTVLAFYLTSDQPNRDEIDFEFLGNVSGQPYILQTNVYADGFDNREERIYLWFDPTKDFHTYSILWNLHQIVFMVDFVPIRTYRNHADKGVAYPRWQPMGIRISLWDGSNWATRGGKDKVDWSKGPFIASFANYTIDACVWKGNARFCRADSSSNWWNKEEFTSLSWKQRRWFKWVRKYHLIYDYCQDNKRFNNNLPKECYLSKY